MRHERLSRARPVTTTKHAFPHLAGHQYMNLTTFRKSGVAVSTPVWFVEAQGKLHLSTLRTYGKVKRIRNNPRVLVAPCDVRGTPLGAAQPAIARVMGADEQARAHYALMHKYKMAYAFFVLVWHYSGKIHDVVYLALAPTDDE